MERTRKHKSSSGGGGELHLVKAAAWAWFQQETVLDQGRSMKEFDIRRTFHDPKPSRYKLEAMELAKRDTENVDEVLNRQLGWSVTKTEVITRDSYLETSTTAISDAGENVLHHHHHQVTISDVSRWRSSSQEREALMDSENYTNRGRKKKGNKFRGFWQRHAVICGSSTHEDVILGTRAFVDGGQRRQRQRQHPENLKAYLPVPVVKLANCRPGRHTRLVIS
ncbi:hypothetical protein M0R45_001601 [Rubus argutus]|uniref:Uncharacterized protein n=1 Tax=Rubus argutus TaxID=59490 RepID=A0AAW1VKR5_RUBAR